VGGKESADMTSRVLCLKVQILLSKGLLDEAISLSESFRSRHPACFDVNAALVDLYHKTAQFDRAEALIGNLRPNSLEQRQRYLRVCGDCALAQYDIPAAESFYQELVDLQAAFADKAKNLIRTLQLHLMKGDIPKATCQAQILDSSYNLPVRDRMRKFYAVLLSEFGKFPRLIEEMSSIRHLSLSEQYDRLLTIVADAPYGCPAAMTVLTAARRLSIWERETPQVCSGLEHQIPRRIVQFWDKADLPEEIGTTTATWKRQCAGFTHILFNDGSANEFIRQHCSVDTWRAFKAARQPTMRSDIFRLAYLYECGGIYADADDLCRRDIAPLFEDGYSLLLLQEYIGSIGNNFIAAAPKHPWLKRVLGGLVARVLERPNDNIWFTTGPGALSHCFCQFYLDDLRGRRLPVGMRLLDVFRVSRYVSVALPLHYKATDHWTSSDSRLSCQSTT